MLRLPTMIVSFRIAITRKILFLASNFSSKPGIFTDANQHMQSRSTTLEDQKSLEFLHQPLDNIDNQLKVSEK